MGSILKSELINPLLRSLKSSIQKKRASTSRNPLHRIRISGEVGLKVENLQFKMYSNWDDHIVDALYFDQEHYSEIDDLKYFSQLATKARVILDIGANTGLYSILSSKSNPRSQIYAFEPYQTNSRRLSRNLELNTCNNVEIVNDALGEDVRKIEFAVPVDGEICDISSADTDFSRRFYKKWRDYENIKVSQNTVDDFVKNNGIQSVDLIKIDVENYEIPVLKGAQQTLREHGPALLVEIFVDKEKDDYFKDYLVPLGYSCYSISKSGLRSHPSIPADQTSRNFLFMKNLSF